jgi:hypothetical protein
MESMFAPSTKHDNVISNLFVVSVGVVIVSTPNRTQCQPTSVMRNVPAIQTARAVPFGSEYPKSIHELALTLPLQYRPIPYFIP